MIGYVDVEIVRKLKQPQILFFIFWLCDVNYVFTDAYSIHVDIHSFQQGMSWTLASDPGFGLDSFVRVLARGAA